MQRWKNLIVEPTYFWDWVGGTPENFPKPSYGHAKYADAHNTT